MFSAFNSSITHTSVIPWSSNMRKNTMFRVFNIFDSYQIRLFQGIRLLPTLSSGAISSITHTLGLKAKLKGISARLLPTLAIRSHSSIAHIFGAAKFYSSIAHIFHSIQIVYHPHIKFGSPLFIRLLPTFKFVRHEKPCSSSHQSIYASITHAFQQILFKDSSFSHKYPVYRLVYCTRNNSSITHTYTL